MSLGASAGAPAHGAGRRAALLCAALLLPVYLLTLAPGVTLWDAGEFITALHGFGVPHPPGTPLFVALGRSWLLLLAPFDAALAANLLSAASTAAAMGGVAWLVARWLRSAAVGVAAGLAAGSMISVWRNATETEVYAPALLLALLTLAAAERAGRSGEARWLLAVAYLLGLAVPLHQIALVAAPASILLATSTADGRLRWSTLTTLGGVLLACVGFGSARPALGLLGAGICALTALALARSVAREARRRVGALLPVGALAVALLGLGALAILPLRAIHDPLLNQGDPSSWAAFLDVLARRQYAVAPLWPRQAPLWLQLANVVEYADWQVALGLAPEPAPSWRRTPLTLLFVALGALGAWRHRLVDRRSWRVLLVLLLAGSVGVVLYLNLKAGPSFGHGVLPAGAPREARERDYFFLFAFVAWGAWAGVGAAWASARLMAGRRWPGVLLAALPVALNWSAATRARGPDATIARDAALALLRSAPRDAVLLTAGDNDSYPLWYLQAVEGVRPDVQVVVTALLPAAWYRDELAERSGLGARMSPDDRWPGLRAVLGALDAAARRAERPVVASALVSRAVREQLWPHWVLHGVLYHREPTRERPDAHAPPDTLPLAGRPVVPAVDTLAARALVPLVARQLTSDGLPRPTPDPAVRQIRRLLACAPLAAQARTEPARRLLATWCNRR